MVFDPLAGIYPYVNHIVAEKYLPEDLASSTAKITLQSKTIFQNVAGVGLDCLS